MNFNREILARPTQLTHQSLVSSGIRAVSWKHLRGKVIDKIMNRIVLIALALASSLCAEPILDLDHCSRRGMMRSPRGSPFKTCPLTQTQNLDILKPPKMFVLLEAVSGQSCVKSIERYQRSDDRAVFAVFVKLHGHGYWLEMVNYGDTLNPEEYVGEQWIAVETARVQMNLSGRYMFQPKAIVSNLIVNIYFMVFD